MAPLTASVMHIFRRSALAAPNAFASVSTLAKRTASSPMSIYDALQRRDGTTTDASDPKYNPGGGAAPAASFNNNVLLIMFAVIGGCMVVVSLWFFLFARNGGFRWRQGDWDDYKSTVLRRKGPDGKTLSNATKSTKLGGGTIVPKWRHRWSGKSGAPSSRGSDSYDKYTDVSTSSPAKSVVSSVDGEDLEMQESPRRHSRTPNRYSKQGHGHQRSHSRLQNEIDQQSQDPDFNAYREERPAAVGGLNKPLEGSHYDYTNTDRSEMSSQTPTKPTRKEKKDRERREKEAKARQKRDGNRKSNGQARPPASPPQQASTLSSVSQQSHPNGIPFPSPSARDRGSYYSSYRPSQPTLRTVPPEEQRNNSHRHSSSQHRRSIPNLPGSYADEDDEGDYVESHFGSEQTGTKSYPHSIPSLPNRSEVGVDDSVSRVGVNPRYNAGRQSGGFRRH